MVNRLYNKQVSPKGYMKGGRVKKMGGGMMKKRHDGKTYDEKRRKNSTSVKKIRYG